jgi:glycosyltransferase involved in cell wall biosynthesis
MIRGFEELGGEDGERPVESLVLTYLGDDVVGGLFPTSEVLRRSPVLSYRSRDAFGDRVERTFSSTAVRSLLMKAYAAVDRAYDLVRSLQVYRIVRARDIHLIHLNNHLQVYGMRAGLWAGVPCVVHQRGLARATRNSDEAGKRKPARRKRKIGDVLGGRALDVAGLFIGISEAVSDSFRRFGVPEDRILTLHDAVAIEDFRLEGKARAGVREQFAIPPDAVVASVFGRVTQWKGQLEFLQSMVPVVERVDALRIMIVGDESDAAKPDYIERVMALAERPPLKGKVVFTGYQKDVAPFYDATDIVVHCSIDPEPFGRVVPEGMASRCAVIGMDEGGPREVITHEVDGLLVAPRDELALGDAVLRLCRDPELRRRLGEEGRRTAERRFAPRSYAARILQGYFAILGARATGGSADAG